MPARSQAQRAYLNAHLGHAWVKAHGFDNRGKLPAKVGGKSVKKKMPKAKAKKKVMPRARKKAPGRRGY